MAATVPAYVADLMASIARVDGKLDTYLKQMEVQDKRSTDLEVRTRKLENRQYWIGGAGAGFGAALSAFIELVFGKH